MHLENQQALEDLRERRANRRGRVAGPTAGGLSYPSEHDDLQLLAIYGVGRKLYAEVRSGKRVLRYRKGQAMPLGHLADVDLLQLQDLNGACVRLLRQDEEKLLCLGSRGLQ